MRIKNWERFQHYHTKRNKNAAFPWIKLYHKLLDDRQWFELDGSASKLLLNCWLLAAERDGELPPLADIAFRLRTDQTLLRDVFPKLDHWIEGIASELLADCKQPVSREREERRGEGEGEGEAGTSAKPKRGARLSADWWPSEENIQYAISHGLSLDRVSTESEKFRNYWTAKAGKDAAKLDWSATWQNWVLKASENGHGNRPQRQSLGDRASELAEQARQLEFEQSLKRKNEPAGSH